MPSSTYSTRTDPDGDDLRRDPPMTDAEHDEFHCVQAALVTTVRWVSLEELEQEFPPFTREGATETRGYRDEPRNVVVYEPEPVMSAGCALLPARTAGR